MIERGPGRLWPSRYFSKVKGESGESALYIKVEDLYKDDGMTVLFTALDAVFEKEKKDFVYEAYTELDIAIQNLTLVTAR